MRKRDFILLFLLCTGTALCGQNERNYIPKITPPSPNAAAIEKYSTIPVDYSTGVPSISYPIWSWARGKLNFGIGMSYHAGGHKVDDMPSNTGLGWSLTGIGRVSRTVRGLPDDDPLTGFMYTDTLPIVSTYAYDGGYYYTSPVIATQTAVSPNTAVTEYNASYSGTVKSIAESQLDGEQDVFSYNIDGLSGRFVIDKSKNIIPLEHTMAKIEMIRNPVDIPLTGESGRIIAFKITNDKGVVYTFEYDELQYSVNYTNPSALEAPPNTTCVSGWLLTKITDPTTKDSIVIDYINAGSGTAGYETGFTQTQSITVNTTGLSAGSGTESFTHIAAGNITPSTVSFPDGSTLNFRYNFEREDLVLSNALTDITVKNYQNSIAKRWRFAYSYFTSPGDQYPIWAISDNDFTKRLRLDSAIEISSDSTLFKPTVFTYNSTQLNPRGSMNIDYWGYNVDPARNNLEYVPKIPLTGSEQAFALYLEGADRRPDSVYSQAAVLEKIQYPTGGTTSFEYENNRAFSSINYYENKLTSNTPEWFQGDFGTSSSITLTNRTDTLVEFLFKTEEFDPRPTPDPEEPQSCFGDAQDLMTTRFEITSTDSTFSTYVEDVYEHFHDGGVKKVISLPLGKSYRIKFVYNSGTQCAFIYPFKALATGTYYIAQQDKLAGGLRIKKVTFSDSVGNTTFQRYEYTNPDGHSSAVFTDATNIPNFTYYKTTVDLTASGGPSTYVRSLNRTSNPTNTLTFNGTPLIYTRVIERERDGSLTERRYDSLISAGNGGDINEYPFMPVQDFPNLSGLLKKQIIKDKNGTVKSEQTITYNKVQNYLLNNRNRNIKTGLIASASYLNGGSYTAKYFAADMYFMYSSRAEITTDQTKTYEGSLTLTTTVEKTYDPFTFYLKTSKTTNSKGEEREEEYSYSADGSGTVYSTMASLNMLGYPIGTSSYKPGVIGGDLSRSQTNYALFQSSTLPATATEKSATFTNALETDITFNEYDDKGNILQYTAKDGVVTSFIWGYHKQYVVAKIVGASYSDIVTASSINMDTVNHPSSDAVMRTELQKLRTAGIGQVTTYTFAPLIGMTSETNPRGRSLYYEYDSFGRLKAIRDQDGKLLKVTDYKYQTTTNQ